MKKNQLFVTVIILSFIIGLSIGYLINAEKNVSNVAPSEEITIDDVMAEFRLIHGMAENYITATNEIIILKKLVDKKDFKNFDQVWHKMLKDSYNSKLYLDTRIRLFEKNYTSSSEYLDTLKMNINEQEKMIWDFLKK